jgi:VWFA-related protein
MQRRTAFVALSSIVAVCLGFSAQEQPTFRTRTNIVRVDVTVLDRRGNPVTSLTADDFEVREDGRLQTITSFKLLEATGQPTDDFSLPIRGPLHAAAEAARDDVRVFLVFWDEYHLGEHVNAPFAREGLKRVMLDAFGPTDLVAIMDQLTPTDAIQFTRDRFALADQVRTLKGRRGVYFARSAAEEEHIRSARMPEDIEIFRSQVTVSAIKAAVARLGALKEGRKSLLLISESLGPMRDAGDRGSVIRELIQAANDSNTAIYIFNPAGLGLLADLATIAYGSGGEPLITNDITHEFPRVVKHSSAAYLLGYATEVPEDGKFHEIKVRVKRGGLDVRARAGYWAPRTADVSVAKAAAAASTLPAPVAAAFGSLTPGDSHLPVDIWTGLAPASGGMRESVAWHSREMRGGALANAAAVSLSASSGGRAVFSGDVPREGTSFDAPPGPLQLTLAIHNSEGEVIDRVSQRLALPDPTGPALALTTPVFVRARNAQELREATVGGQAPLFAGRELERTDRVFVRFDTYGAAAGAAVSATLLDRRGAKLLELPVSTDAGRSGYQIDLPLGGLARGEYVIAIEARGADARAETHVAFRVVR